MAGGVGVVIAGKKRGMPSWELFVFKLIIHVAYCDVNYIRSGVQDWFYNVRAK